MAAQPPEGDERCAATSQLPNIENATISVPWNELRDLLTKSGRDEREAAPVDHVFSEASYSVTLGERHAAALAEVEVTTLAAGWTLVPLGTADAGIVSAIVNGKRRRLVMRDQSLFTDSRSSWSSMKRPK